MREEFLEQIKKQVLDALQNPNDLEGKNKEEMLQRVEKSLGSFLSNLYEEFCSEQPTLPEATIKECCGKDGLFHFSFLGYSPPVLIEQHILCPHCGFGGDDD